MNKSKLLLLFFSLSLSACHTTSDQDRSVPFNNEPFTFKITPGKTKTPSSIMPAGFGSIRGPSINSSNEENSITKDLGRCRNNLRDQQLHFELSF